jgi:hypothetical protein
VNDWPTGGLASPILIAWVSFGGWRNALSSNSSYTGSIAMGRRNALDNIEMFADTSIGFSERLTRRAGQGRIAVSSDFMVAKVSFAARACGDG